MEAQNQTEVIRSRLADIGRSAVDVARELGVSPQVVRGVISGRIRGDRGAAHKVAVALGLKDGVVVADDMPVSEALKLAVGR